MEEYGIRNNGIFRVDSNQMRAVDGKQRIYLEWPYLIGTKFFYRNSGLYIPNLLQIFPRYERPKISF